MHSFIFRDATVVDGSGASPRRADVAVTGNRITAIGAELAGPAETVVEAGDLVLAPGFIDIHGHTDMTVFRYPMVESKIMQGVTVEVTGNCGLGLFPVRPGRQEELSAYLHLHEFELPGTGLTWEDFAGYADMVDSLRPAIHLAPLVGHAPLRIAAMGMDNREATPAELVRMRQLLAEALSQGAWGMSTGLIYPPGSYAGAEELVELARVVAAHDGLYTSHIRDEGDGLFSALDEAIALGRESSVRVQVSHLKALGRSNWGRGTAALERLAAARTAGVDIAADQYPYAASATTLTAVVPQWAHAGGVPSLLARLQDPAMQTRLEAEIDAAIARREGAAGIAVATCRSAANRRFTGRTLEEVAAAWGCKPARAVARLLVEEQGNVGAIFFSMTEGDVATILADPLVAVGSDGHGLNAAHAAGEATHPRSYGTFARVLGRYVREGNVLSLAAAIHKMTGLPASRLGFVDRGLILPGHAADLVLFDPAAIGDPADYADPHRYATGIVHLLVDGRPAIWDGMLTGCRVGRVLRKQHKR